ncbi:neural proliferation differentiation and control protein 1 isoform X2 [Leuresthes tenuis]|uniref:neural proliferation differentiation and control protein 1 isoform X2 n=1 Tax=Leuresthes tenuis TaxID=355514 RepID=UPI003B5094D2
MRTALLDQAVVFAALLALCTCVQGSHLCPSSLDCARARRHFCLPGGSHCGPCLNPLVENSHGRCVIKRRHTRHSSQFIKGKVNTYQELDEEIDFLSTIISEQRMESVVPAPPFQDVKSKQLSKPSGESLTEQPASQSVSFSSTPPSTTINHTPALLSNPINLPHPSADRVLIIMSSVFVVAGSLALIIAGSCWVSLGTRIWPTEPRCTTTSTRSSRCSPWRSTGMSQNFLTQEHRQMRRMRMEISLCMSVLDWHQRVKWR